MRIRQWTALVLEKVVWKVFEEFSDNVISKRPLLDSIRISNNELLAAELDRHDCLIDRTDMNQEIEECVGQTVRNLLEEAVHHGAGGFDFDGLEEDDV